MLYVIDIVFKSLAYIDLEMIALFIVGLTVLFRKGSTV